MSESHKFNVGDYVAVADPYLHGMIYTAKVLSFFEATCDGTITPCAEVIVDATPNFDIRSHVRRVSVSELHPPYAALDALKEKTVKENYFVIHQPEGDHLRLDGPISHDEVLSRVRTNYYGGAPYLRNLGRCDGGCLPDEGVVIIKGEIVTPKEKKTVTEWELQ